ncbi:hypothetical protein [Leadbettera azotonutricia]|uniref:Glycoside hydrolase family 2 n=1 Tax=Leadbettera azotonutricia (strain ATCC BAA-888 / DSM 13862 / ZAS-9) TaxID=545695 RepID=F5YF97_LEAAZ|nr:hypothetical protein [Leadbettera azotonutricia]AEF82861.1 conserved hypothetical protein [Leadbettera azotonutricia ZAS-9]
MLYPKREKPLGEGDFENPTSEYRATPFWAWNTKLEKDELTWQIGELKKLGFGGFHMHVRTGMATEYLSDEYMDIIGACVEKARAEKMLPWLYDEDRWPSGAAGGLVTQNPDYRIRHLLLTRRPYGTPVDVIAEKQSRASSGRCENGKLLAVYDISLDSGGNILSYSSIGENDKPKGFKLYAYAESALPNPWFNNQTYVDTLNPKAIKEFIKVTYERYGSSFQKDFGSLIHAIFTDEPQFSQKGTLHFAHEERDVTLPWTPDFPDSYKQAYGGEDLLKGIPELLWDLPNGKISKVRYHYHDHIAERFSSAFADQCGAWCSAHGLMLTGHMMEEPTLESQTHALGEAMRSYRSFGLPGIDMLCDRREFTTAKQAQSAARQYGYPGVLSELYGVTNWDFDFRGHKLQGDWQAALGVTVRVPHLSWVSMNGEAKRDYPGTFNYQAPWYKEYPYVEDHFARLNTALTRGKAVARVGVIHPIESYWLHWGPRESTEAVRSGQDENFQNLCDWLLRGAIDFDYICESTLPALCDTKNIKAGAFPVGKMAYSALIVPAMETIRASTLDRLEAFKKTGGRLIFLGPAPSYTDAAEDSRGKKLWEQSEHIGFDRLTIINALEDLREIQIKDSSGADANNFLYQLREDTEGRWLFIAQADKANNPDIPQGDDYRIRIRGEWQLTQFDTLNGSSSPVNAEIAGSWTTLITRLWDHDSLLLKLEKAGSQAASGKADTAHPDKAAIAGAPLLFTSPVPITLDEPNVLLLDIAEYALDSEAYKPKEELFRLDNELRERLSWPSRGEAVAQPWVEHDSSTPHTLKLRFSFDSEIEIKGAELALENAANTKVALNGEAAGPVRGWYVDKCIGKVKLPAIKKGANTLELSFPYGRKVDVEYCFILGDFGVKVAGTKCTLTEPVRELAFGDITRQGLPFYGGNVCYHLEAETKSGSLSIEASSYRFMLLKVKVDGADKGVIAYSPYKLEVKAPAGKHKIDITGFGCRVNTFGQLHNNMDHEGYWWGPNSWRTTGPAWTYEYKFWPQGVLKSPEIF